MQLNRLVSPPAPDVTAMLTDYLTPDPVRVRARDARHLSGARRLTVLADRHPVDVIRLGDTPRRLLLAHGWAGHPSQLGPLASALVDAGFEVALPSMPGHGHSPSWDGRGTANFSQFASTIAATAEAVGGVYAIVGHSGGALSGIMAAAGVVGDPVPVRRFVGLAPVATLRDSVDRHLDRIGASAPQAAAFDEAMAERFGEEVFDRTDAVALAGDLDHIPALLVHDNDDVHVPIGQAQAIADAWPESTLMATRRYGHHLLLRRPDVAAQVVRFLSDPVVGPGA